MASDDLKTLDDQRARWRRARKSLHLVHVTDESFALGGAGARVKELSARILILPTDPIAHRFDFDDAFRQKWKAASVDPATGQSPRWGNSEGATSTSFVTHDLANDQEWDRYAAIDHAGGLDIGLGRESGLTHDKRRVFNLITLVGRVWAACAIHSQLAISLEIPGPRELTVAIRQTQNAWLGGFAQGWRDDWSYGVSACGEPNLLLHREIASLTSDTAMETAYSIGRQIENAFGSTHQRFRIWKDEALGDFDRSRYSRH